MTDWQADGLCRQVDSELFFPEPGVSPNAALRICMGCDSRRQCLEWALRNRENGVWGGTTERERLRMLRAQKGQPVLFNAGQLVRDARIQRLTDEGLSAAEVAAEVGCHQRTVTRVRSASRKDAA